MTQHLTQQLNCEKWRERHKYGQRALVENAFSRETRFFSDYITSKKISKAKKEMSVRFALSDAFMFMSSARNRVELELEILARKIKERIKEEEGITTIRSQEKVKKERGYLL